jgi:hypothetical protein
MIVLTGVVGAYPMAMADVDLGGPRVSPGCVSTSSKFHACTHCLGLSWLSKSRVNFCAPCPSTPPSTLHIQYVLTSAIFSSFCPTNAI